MAGERRALLVATDAYTDTGLARLRAPTGDAEALAKVLGDPAIGAFAVQRLINRPTDEVAQEIEGFFGDARLQDLLLLYVSGHGVLSPMRRLYFATPSTKLSRLRATAIEDRFIHDVMQHTRARSVVLMLDCCHSGAFAEGLAPKNALGVDVEHRFEGRGRITLTASTELEYAFEEAEGEARLRDLGAAAPGSLFTRYLVEGLKTGQADVDDDGLVSIDELYDYVYARVRERSPYQTPGRSGAGYGDIIIARSVRQPSPPERCQAPDAPHAGAGGPAIGDFEQIRETGDTELAATRDEARRSRPEDKGQQVSVDATAAPQRPAFDATPTPREESPRENEPAVGSPQLPTPIAVPIPGPRRRWAAVVLTALYISFWLLYAALLGLKDRHANDPLYWLEVLMGLVVPATVGALINRWLAALAAIIFIPAVAVAGETDGLAVAATEAVIIAMGVAAVRAAQVSRRLVERVRRGQSRSRQ